MLVCLQRSRYMKTLLTFNVFISVSTFKPINTKPSNVSQTSGPPLSARSHTSVKSGASLVEDSWGDDVSSAHDNHKPSLLQLQKERDLKQNQQVNLYLLNTANWCTNFNPVYNQLFITNWGNISMSFSWKFKGFRKNVSLLLHSIYRSFCFITRIHFSIFIIKLVW